MAESVFLRGQKHADRHNKITVLVLAEFCFLDDFDPIFGLRIDYVWFPRGWKYQRVIKQKGGKR